MSESVARARRRARAFRNSDHDLAVLRALSRYGAPTSTYGVEVALSHPEAWSVVGRLRSLRGRGYVETDGKRPAFWSLTDRGRDALTLSR